MLWFCLFLANAFADDDSLWGTLDEDQEDSDENKKEDEQKIELKIIKVPDTQEAVQKQIQTVSIN